MMDTGALEVGSSPSSFCHGSDDAGSLPEVLVADPTRCPGREDPRSHGSGVGGIRLVPDDVSDG